MIERADLKLSAGSFFVNSLLYSTQLANYTRRSVVRFGESGPYASAKRKASTFSNEDILKLWVLVPDVTDSNHLFILISMIILC